MTYWLDVTYLEYARKNAVLNRFMTMSAVLTPSFLLLFFFILCAWNVYIASLRRKRSQLVYDHNRRSDSGGFCFVCEMFILLHTEESVLNWLMTISVGLTPMGFFWVWNVYIASHKRKRSQLVEGHKRRSHSSGLCCVWNVYIASHGRKRSQLVYDHKRRSHSGGLFLCVKCLYCFTEKKAFSTDLWT